MSESKLNSIGTYILDANGNPVPEPDILKWAAWRERHDGTILRDFLFKDQVLVSTIFTGIDLSFFHSPSLPRVFETMVFSTGSSQYQARYSTQKKAIRGHATALRWAKAHKDDLLKLGKNG